MYVQYFLFFQKYISLTNTAPLFSSNERGGARAGVSLTRVRPFSAHCVHCRHQTQKRSHIKKRKKNRGKERGSSRWGWHNVHCSKNAAPQKQRVTFSVAPCDQYRECRSVPRSLVFVDALVPKLLVVCFFSFYCWIRFTNNLLLSFLVQRYASEYDKLSLPSGQHLRNSTNDTKTCSCLVFFALFVALPQ